MVNLVIKDITGQAYELTGRSSSPRASAAKRYSSDAYSTFRFVATLPLAPDQWLQILRSTHQRLPNFHSTHPAEVHQAVAQSIMRGDLALYQLPSLSISHGIQGKKGFGLSIIKGPNPHSATDLTPEAIDSADAAQQLLNELGISSQAFLAYLTNENIVNSEQKQSPFAEALQLLASGELLAYKIPLPPKTPPAKAVEYVAAASADKPVPLAPESSSGSQVNKVESTASSSPVASVASSPNSGSTAGATSHPNMPQIKATIKKSPTLMKNLSTLTQNGWQIEYGPAGAGSFADRDRSPKRIVIDQSELNDPNMFVQTLAHETGHAMYLPDSYTPPHGLTKEAYVNSNAASALKDEGEATLMNLQIREEILNNGGPDIGIAGTQDEKYKKIYESYKIDGDRELAREDIGFIFANNETPSTDPTKTYLQYYSKPYEDYWDSTH